MDTYEPPGQKEETFAADYMKKAENVEMTDNDVELAENNGADFKHDSLMEYSNIQLDFIKVFGKKVFVMVIGKIRIFWIGDKFYFSDAGVRHLIVGLSQICFSY